MMFGSHNLKKTSRNNTSLTSPPDEDNEDEADGNNLGTGSIHSSTNIIPVAGPSGLNNNKTTLNGNLEAYFQLYIKNKITCQNAWQVNIFEYITSLLESNTNLRSLLQKACTSLDIGAKVYSVRVDDVHYQTLQLANSLALLYKNNLLKRNHGADNDYEDEQNDEQEDKNTREPPRKKRRGKLLSASDERRTVNTNEQTITGTLVKLPRKTMLIQNTTNSYLNLTLPIAPHNCELLVNNSMSNFKWCEYNSNSFVKSIQVPVPEELQLISSTICPTFQEFDIDQWDPDEHADLFNKSNLSEAEFMALLKSPRMQNTQSKTLSPNDCDEDCGKSTISGVTALTNDDDTRIVHYDDDLLNKTQEDIEVMETMSHGQNNKFDFITDMRPNTAGENLEYSYRKIPNETLFESMWAGPSHWKLKHLQRTSTPNSETEKVDRCKKRNGVILPLYLEDENEKELLKMIKPSTKPMYRTYTLQNEVDDSVLPEKINIDVADVLFNTFYRRQSKNQYVDSSKIINVDDDDDRNDDGRSGWGDATPHHVTDDEDSGVQVSTIGTPGTDIQNNWILTSPGNVIKKGWVTYSSHAKRIDMKQLKTTMWNEIAQKCDKTVPDTTLSNIYKQLPEKLTAVQADNLSSPLAFVALLHLANEHSLILEGNESLSDIIIKKKETD